MSQVDALIRMNEMLEEDNKRLRTELEEADSLFKERELAWETIHRYLDSVEGIDLPTAIEKIGTKLSQHKKNINDTITRCIELIEDHETSSDIAQNHAYCIVDSIRNEFKLEEDDKTCIHDFVDMFNQGGPTTRICTKCGKGEE